MHITILLPAETVKLSIQLCPRQWDKMQYLFPHVKLCPFCNKPSITLVRRRCKNHSVYFDVVISQAVTQVISEKALQLVVDLPFVVAHTWPKICHYHHYITKLSDMKLDAHFPPPPFSFLILRLAREQVFRHLSHLRCSQERHDGIVQARALKQNSKVT
jgi:hypothetical protein